MPEERMSQLPRETRGAQSSEPEPESATESGYESEHESESAAPSIDPELAQFLDAVQPSLPHRQSPELLDELRELSAAEEGEEDPTLGGLYEVEDLVAASHPRLTVCRPVRPGSPAISALYWAHGGGMAAGSSRTGLAFVVEHAHAVGAAVVAVDYRLAPEHPYPAALDDSVAGLTWLFEHGEELGVDPGGIVVFGASAGAGIAAGTVLKMRDANRRLPRGLMLISAMLDDRNDTESAHQMVGSDPWDRAANAVAWQALLGEARGGPEVPAYAAPARAHDLSGLPPAYLSVGSAETFRDENVRFAMKLWLAGGSAELHVWPGAYHGFEAAVPDAAVARASRHAASQWLSRILR